MELDELTKSYIIQLTGNSPDPTYIDRLASRAGLVAFYKGQLKKFIKVGLGKRLGSKSFNLMLRRRKRDSRGLKYVNGSCFHHLHIFKTTMYIEKKRTVDPLGHFAG